MTDFADTFVGKQLAHLEAWTSHIIHTATAQQALGAGKDIIEKSVGAGITAGLAAKMAGGDKDAVLNAAKTAVLSVGVTVSTADAEHLAATISNELHG